MLYPLSYEGARAQSSDQGVRLGRQGVAGVHPRHPYPCSPSPGAHTARIIDYHRCIVPCLP